MPSLPRLSLLASVAALAPLTPAQLQVPDGFQADARVLPAPAKGWVGLGRLEGGGLVTFDGARLVQLDPASGAVRKTLVTLTTAVFGSDVRVGPSGERVFFGESSTGALWVHDLTTGRTRSFTTLGGNFSFAFHPSEGERFLYVAARPGFTGTAKVFRVDTVTGAQDLIAEADGFAGPIAFDARGDLYFAPAPKEFGKPGLGRVLRWRSDQVLGAIGSGQLGEKNAVVFVRGFDNAIDLTFDGEGTLYVADAFSASSSSLLEVGPRGGTFATNVVRFPGRFLTTARYAPDHRPFERFGHPHAELWLLATDFVAKHDVIRLAPRRPDLAVHPSVHPPKGSPLRYDGAGLPRGGLALWLLGAGLVPERPLLPLGAGGLAFPDLGIVPTAPFVAVVTPVDAGGAARLAFPAPLAASVQWTTQVLAGPVAALPGGTPASPWVTSNPVTVVTQ